MPGPILMPLPDHDFDVTEVAVPWRLATRAGHDVVFATEAGQPGAADPRLLTGVLFGRMAADEEPRRWYRDLERATEFRQPARWSDLVPSNYAGLLLPGGHAPGMRQYLGSAQLQDVVARFWQLGRPVGAICHGVLVLARATDPDRGRSVLAETRTTCLPKYMERTAYWATAWRLGRYYRTYPLYVEDEVRRALARPAEQFVRGPVSFGRRGTDRDDRGAFCVTDGRYVSARWPGDAYLFARRFLTLLGTSPREGARSA
jgi:putative intracellular protease/amidase